MSLHFGLAVVADDQCSRGTCILLLDTSVSMRICRLER